MIPDGLVAQAAPEGKGLPPVTGVKDTNDAAVSADTLTGQWSVLWFYPLASTFG